MKPIKFSHMYNKLKSVNIKDPVELILVLRTHYRDLPLPFLKYDASYENVGGTIEYYPIPCDELTLLLFRDSSGKLFTTVRSYNPEKYSFYLGEVGHSFRVVLKDEKEIVPHPVCGT